nr:MULTISPECIES: YqhG family protein [Paenibacillus]
MRREDVVFGSKRLRQIWAAARSEGRCLYLFEDPGAIQRRTIFPAAYEPWLAVCFKVELSCDLKREELHFVGVSLLTGEIRERFEHTLDEITMTPRVPENVHVQPSELTLDEGARLLERHITEGLAVQDYGWAEEARKRLESELQIIDAYYQELIRETEEEQRGPVEEQYQSRRQETSWQYEPHIAVSPVVYGLFHLRSRPKV